MVSPLSDPFFRTIILHNFKVEYRKKVIERLSVCHLNNFIFSYIILLCLQDSRFQWVHLFHWSLPFLQSLPHSHPNYCLRLHLPRVPRLPSRLREFRYMLIFSKSDQTDPLRTSRWRNVFNIHSEEVPWIVINVKSSVP